MHDYNKLHLAQVLFYGGHLVWVYIAWTLWRWRAARARGQARRRGDGMLALRLLLAALFIWMRFVEPNWITVRETAIKLGPAPATGTRVALISDLHLGAFNGPGLVGRVAERVNALKPDCVLIAGDFLYAPDAPLDQLFAGFKAFRIPVYAVLGNHDNHELPPPHGGEVPTQMLIDALARAGVALIEDRVVDCGHIKVAGVGDLWSGRADFQAAGAYRGDAPLVLVTHNPDAAYLAPKNLSPLLLSGHTHGGQIRLPFVYHYVIPVKGPFDRGLLSPVEWNPDPSGRPAVFTTSGVGEIGLPMRLLNPPVIDLLLL
jgi:predicted MPP superfamily phosphohydrolase